MSELQITDFVYLLFIVQKPRILLYTVFICIYLLFMWDCSQVSATSCHFNFISDDTLLAYLKSLDLQPALHLDPPFTPLWTEYHAHVSYDITMVRVTANPLHCHVQTRFDHRLGPIR